MTRIKRIGGAALPEEWNAVEALNAAQLRQQQKTIPLDHVPVTEPINIAQKQGIDLITSGDWPVRDQAHRGTCNAFAAVAAEELSNWRETGIMEPYSEEYLYAATRKQSLSGLNADACKVKKKGTTFLRQVKDALRPAQKGLVRAGDPDYDASPETTENYAVARAPSPHAVITPHGSYAHDVFERPVVGPNSVWREGPTEGTTVVDIFLNQLQKGVPVVASFAILEGPGARAFTSSDARAYGVVSYPHISIVIADQLKPGAGHTVCLTGYIPDPLDPDVGWFVFRNSYGRDDFAHDAGTTNAKLVAPAQGYGLIAAWDVEIYCWEYLYRT